MSFQKKYDMSLATLLQALELLLGCLPRSQSLRLRNSFLYVQAIRGLMEQHICWKKSRKHDFILDINGSFGEAKEARPGNKGLRAELCECNSESQCRPFHRDLRYGSR
jgi:hypothetical protein